MWAKKKKKKTSFSFITHDRYIHSVVIDIFTITYIFLHFLIFFIQSLFVNVSKQFSFFFFFLLIIFLIQHGNNQRANWQIEKNTKGIEINIFLFHQNEITNIQQYLFIKIYDISNNTHFSEIYKI